MGIKYCLSFPEVLFCYSGWVCEIIPIIIMEQNEQPSSSYNMLKLHLFKYILDKYMTNCSRVTHLSSMCTWADTWTCLGMVSTMSYMSLIWGWCRTLSLNVLNFGKISYIVLHFSKFWSFPNSIATILYIQKLAAS